MAMKFYLATSPLLPRRFRLWLLATCIVAIHLPLVALIAWGISRGRPMGAEIVPLALASAGGALLVLFAVGHLLDQLQAMVGRAPRQSQGANHVGDLLESVSRTADARLRALDLAAKEDMLTGILNRRGFLAYLDALTPEQCRGAVALLDLDHFKAVNDALGHEMGDEVLRGFAARLSTELRRDDVIARWSGEAFAILFNNTTEEEAGRVLERLRRSLADLPLAAVDYRPITFSAGVCRFRGEAVEQVLRVADEALYEAKQSGRDRVCRARRDAPLGGGA